MPCTEFTYLLWPLGFILGPAFLSGIGVPLLNGSSTETASWGRFAVACLDQAQIGVGNALENGREDRSRLEAGKHWVCFYLCFFFLFNRFLSSVLVRGAHYLHKIKKKGMKWEGRRVAKPIKAAPAGLQGAVGFSECGSPSFHPFLPLCPWAAQKFGQASRTLTLC